MPFGNGILREPPGGRLHLRDPNVVSKKLKPKDVEVPGLRWRAALIESCTDRTLVTITI